MNASTTGDLTESALTDAELTKFRKRIGTVLKKYPLLPFFALQYRICEVSKSRPDPRALRAALNELADNPRPRLGRIATGITEILPDGFSDETFFEDEIAQHTRDLTKALQQMLTDGSDSAIRCLTALVVASCTKTDIPNHLERNRQRRVMGDLTFGTGSVILDLRAKNGTPITALVTHDLEWLYPDDAVFWEGVRHSLEAETALVILARKIAPATFSVLKRIGAKGIQYYSMLVAPTRERAVARSASVGWIHTRLAETEQLDAFARQLRRVLAVVALPNAHAREAMKIAIDLQLNQPETLGPDTLLRWANAVQLSAPAVWFSSVQRWKHVESNYRRARSAQTEPGPQEFALSDGSLPQQPSPGVKAKSTRPSSTEMRRVPFPIR